MISVIWALLPVEGCYLPRVAVAYEAVDEVEGCQPAHVFSELFLVNGVIFLEGNTYRWEDVFPPIFLSHGVS
jgi:hypothetical protein